MSRFRMRCCASGCSSPTATRSPNLDQYPFVPEGLPPDQPVLVEGGGGVDDWSFDMDYRVRPLPPPGPLAFICAWPGRRISSSGMEVDSGAVRAAADTAVTLWPDDPYCGDD
jgi:hypothetical protein